MFVALLGAPDDEGVAVEAGVLAQRQVIDGVALPAVVDAVDGRHRVAVDRALGAIPLRPRFVRAPVFAHVRDPAAHAAGGAFESDVDGVQLDQMRGGAVGRDPDRSHGRAWGTGFGDHGGTGCGHAFETQCSGHVFTKPR